MCAMPSPRRDRAEPERDRLESRIETVPREKGKSGGDCSGISSAMPRPLRVSPVLTARRSGQQRGISKECVLPLNTAGVASSSKNILNSTREASIFPRQSHDASRTCALPQRCKIFVGFLLDGGALFPGSSVPCPVLCAPRAYLMCLPGRDAGVSPSSIEADTGPLLGESGGSHGSVQTEQAVRGGAAAAEWGEADGGAIDEEAFPCASWPGEAAEQEQAAAAASPAALAALAADTRDHGTQPLPSLLLPPPPPPVLGAAVRCAAEGCGAVLSSAGQVSVLFVPACFWWSREVKLFTRCADSEREASVEAAWRGGRQ